MVGRVDACCRRASTSTSMHFVTPLFRRGRRRYTLCRSWDKAKEACVAARDLLVEHPLFAEQGTEVRIYVKRNGTNADFAEGELWMSCMAGPGQANEEMMMRGYGKETEAALVDAGEEGLPLPGQKAVVLPITCERELLGILVVEENDVAGLKDSDATTGSYVALKGSGQWADAGAASTFSNAQQQRILRQLTTLLSSAVAEAFRESTSALTTESAALLSLRPLVEELTGPLSALRTLGSLLATQLQPEEPKADLVRGMIEESSRLGSVTAQLQDALFPSSTLPLKSLASDYGGPSTLLGEGSSAQTQMRILDSLTSAGATEISAEVAEESLFTDGKLIDITVNSKKELVPIRKPGLPSAKDIGNFQLCRLHDVLEPLLTDASRSLKGISFDVKWHGDRDIVRADPLKLRRALGCVIDTVLSVTKSGGLVQVCVFCKGYDEKDVKKGVRLLLQTEVTLSTNAISPLGGAVFGVHLGKRYIEEIGGLLQDTPNGLEISIPGWNDA